MTNQIWHIGEIKFFDVDKGFGFITDYNDKEDYFVHKTNVKTNRLGSGKKVIFELSPSKKNTGKFEAVNLRSLSEFKSNNDFLIAQFLKSKDIFLKRDILSCLPNECISFLLENEIASYDIISNDAEYKKYLNLISRIDNLFGHLVPNDTIKFLILNSIEQISTNEYKIWFWLEDIINKIPEIHDLSVFFCKQSDSIKLKIYRKTNTSEHVLLFKNFRQVENQLESIRLFSKLIRFEHDEFVINQLILLTFDKYFFRINSETNEQVYKESLLIYNSLPKLFTNKFLEAYHDFANDFYKTKLWLYDYVETSNYDMFHANFIFLKPEEQKRYIKKLFILIHKKAESVTIESILRLKNLTFTFDEGKKFNLDFSCNILLSTIEKIQQGNFLNEENIFHIITSQIEKDSSELLTLSGFFETCQGRTIPDETEETLDGIKEIITLKQIHKPRNVKFCEGVRFGRSGKDNTFNHDCWWCRGGSCYDANQTQNHPENYNNYTLGVFLKILNIEFDNKEYFDFLGLLNKIDVFLNHLNCRTCNHILKPSQEIYHSYYRISNFICSNKNCNDKNKIYLSHCLGARKTAIKSKCENLIDSRDTKRCNYKKYNPQSKYEEYGPYICNLCGSCCSQKSLKRKYDELRNRNENMQPGLAWKVSNNVGHLENNEIFCFKCGVELENYEIKYRESVELLNNPTDELKVLSKGVNKFGFWYMVKAKDVFFETIKEIGFKVSDAKGNDKEVKFIGQGNINLLSCSSCNSKYNKSRVEFIIEEKTLVKKSTNA